MLKLLYQTSPCLKSFENTGWKGEIARNEKFLHFPRCFLSFWRISAIFIKFKIVISKLAQFGRVWKLSFGKGLNFSDDKLKVADMRKFLMEQKVFLVKEKMHFSVYLSGINPFQNDKL